MRLLFCLKSISNTIVCNPQKKNILKSICQQCNNSKLTLIFNGPPNIDLTTQSATMGGPLNHPWFRPILHTGNTEGMSLPGPNFQLFTRERPGDVAMLGATGPEDRLPNVAEKVSWFIRHLSDGLYIFCLNLWNFSSCSSDIWA